MVEGKRRTLLKGKAAVAVNVGSGPDVVLSTNDDVNMYADKLLHMTDPCEYPGRNYGG